MRLAAFLPCAAAREALDRAAFGGTRSAGTRPLCLSDEDRATAVTADRRVLPAGWRGPHGPPSGPQHPPPLALVHSLPSGSHPGPWVNMDLAPTGFRSQPYANMPSQRPNCTSSRRIEPADPSRRQASACPRCRPIHLSCRLQSQPSIAGLGTQMACSAHTGEVNSVPGAGADKPAPSFGDART